MERERLSSRLGFILISAGCAIGVGNVWKFPWLTGQNGGGAFVALYLLFLAILGLPVLVIELSIGRAAQKSTVKMYRPLEKPGSKWHIHGYFALAANVILMMFYTTVAGWILKYVVKSIKGEFVGLDAYGVKNAYSALKADTWTQVLYVAIIVVLAFIVLSFGVQNGLEKITKYMMVALIAIMAVMAIRGLFMNGALEGIKFYLVPDFSKITIPVVVSAMNQAFFTLSLGAGSMAIFGSYIDKSRSLKGEAISIIVLDTFVAIVAGLIIFPACFTYGVEPDAGPSLIFVTLPNIFNNMKFGRAWSALFFVFMSFAAFSTVLAVCENILACFIEITGWSRKKASVYCGIGILLLSLPCIFGFNIWSGFTPFGTGTNVMDLEDFIVSNCLLPIGALIFVVFASWNFGWGWDNFLKEANAGEGKKVGNWSKWYIKYVLPIIIMAIFIIGLVQFFA